MNLIPDGFLEKMASGSFKYDPLFLYADNVRANEIKRGDALSSEARHRLVKRPESPTRELQLENAYERHKFEFNALKLKHCELLPESAVMVEHDVNGFQRTPMRAMGCRTIVEHRKYSDVEQMWRVRTEVDSAMGLPPENSGPRISDELSLGGARKIAESCEYMAHAFGGYKTFCTGTLDDDARKKIRSYDCVPSSCEELYSVNILPKSCRHKNHEKRLYTSVCFLPCDGIRVRNYTALAGCNLGDDVLANGPCSPVFFGNEVVIYTPVEFLPVHTIQRETSRTLDAMNKFYQRGGLVDVQETANGDVIAGVKSAGFSLFKGSKIRLNKWARLSVDGPASALVYTVQAEPWAKVEEIIQENHSALPGYEIEKGVLAEGRCSLIKFKRETLRYTWVCEVPENSYGEENPHIHLMMDWAVDYRLFKGWAARWEKAWGGGYFHLEKIKDPMCAGAYMAKAAGYFAKGTDGSQGTVRGNRYGISEKARAPSWVVISQAQLDCMGQLINDVFDHYKVTYQEDIDERKRLNKVLSEIPKEKKDARKKVAEKLTAVRKKIKAVPIEPNKYNIVIRGLTAAAQFFTWAKEECKPDRMRPEWLPEKPQGAVWNEGENAVKDSIFLTKLRKKFADKRFWRRLSKVPKWITETFSDSYWHQNKGDYIEPLPYWECMDLCQ